MKKIIYNILIIISLCSFIFFGYKIYSYIKDEKAQKELNKSIIESAITINDDIDIENDESPMKIDFKALKEQNKDIVAWIYSDGTEINYPIVQAKDNDYYLRRMLNGSYNVAGTLFMDYRNKSDFTDYNTTIFGHNMKNGTMFGSIPKYQKQDYYDEHKEIYLFTEDKNYVIELFAGYTTSSESDIYKFPKTTKTNEKLIKTAIKNSTFKSEIKPQETDKIITLSTCTYSFENARYVLLGVLKEI